MSYSTMAITRTRASRVFTISFPEPLAQQVEQTAREESRNISELFREAFRAYKFQAMERRLDTLRPAVSDSLPATQEEIQQFIDQLRTERSKKRNQAVDRRP